MTGPWWLQLPTWPLTAFVCCLHGENRNHALSLLPPNSYSRRLLPPISPSLPPRPKQVACPAHLVLPRDGHRARGELGVEVVVCVVQIDALHSGELLDVQHVLTVHSAGLPGAEGWSHICPACGSSGPEPGLGVLGSRRESSQDTPPELLWVVAGGCVAQRQVSPGEGSAPVAWLGFLSTSDDGLWFFLRPLQMTVQPSLRSMTGTLAGVTQELGAPGCPAQGSFLPSLPYPYWTDVG